LFFYAIAQLRVESKVIYLFGTNSSISAITSTWRWILLIMVLFIILTSALVTGNPLFGWLINEQNRLNN